MDCPDRRRGRSRPAAAVGPTDVARLGAVEAGRTGDLRVAVVEIELADDVAAPDVASHPSGEHVLRNATRTFG